MSSPSSLRDLYSTNTPSWTFANPANASGPSSPPPAPPNTPSYTFSNRPAQNSIFELSPGLADPGGADLRLLLKTLVASAFLQYTSTAIAMPWEVGKCLLQVQWVPRDAGEEEVIEEVVEEEEELSSDSGEDSYFADPSASAGPSRYPAPRPADERGYIVRKSVMEEGTRPEYVLPVGSVNGVWAMIKRLGGFRSEGWLALWKGLLTSCVTDLLSSTLQPLIHSALQSIFAPASTSPYLFPNTTTAILLPVASHLITGFLLSPLDLVRTRLIVQSFTERHRTYTGPVDALRSIARDEGGVRGLYLHPHLLIPTLLDNSLRPLISLGLPPLLAARMYSNAPISADTHPVAWGVVELASSCVGLLATLPFETVRRRLQTQVRGSAAPLKTCVETRPAPYNGVVDALWHILTEERSDLPIQPRRRRRGEEKGKGKGTDGKESVEEEDGPVSWWRSTGLGQLYRGLGMRLGASAIVFLLGMVSGGDEDAGWAEL
ncbi:mitochondrial carrier [Auriscalpium vulgare]|uniref:Mitochondrial carrier n=1 Tax=Auriscalpium vulgare TaxID=40419 RepID=A0ACB8S9B3_9AGAM|nr:mitochondrial carrier [Auriscalpium vulgare]